MNIAIITGASSGIGEQFLRRLVREHGAYGSLPFEQIWVIARRTDRLNTLKDELDPERIRIFGLDLTAPGSIDTLSKALAEENPTIGILVNCAGFGRVGLLEEQLPIDIRSMITLNCAIPAELSGVCLPYMIPTGNKCDFRNGPRILNIASSAGFMPQPGFAAYAASKSFIIHFSRALHAELKMHNIASTTVCPGPVATDFMSTASGKETSEFSGIKALFVVHPDKLAAKAIAASRKGRAVLVYGFSQKAFHVAAKIFPTRFMMFLASIFAGNTDEKSNSSLSASTSSSEVNTLHNSATTVLLPFGSSAILPQNINSANTKGSSPTVPGIHSRKNTDSTISKSDVLDKLASTSSDSTIHNYPETSESARSILATYSSNH